MKKIYVTPEINNICIISAEDVLSVSQGSTADPYVDDKFYTPTNG